MKWSEFWRELQRPRFVRAEEQIDKAGSVIASLIALPFWFALWVAVPLGILVGIIALIKFIWYAV
jgi:hypothetical protein